ncbi:hypothetical protein PIB30_070231 [Stylosanthes scabra]|uniref:Small auxin up regulated protein n=1 Tax=Stylosanthes scabra TaxID=79078 RepID=A0ABU6WLS4_9FABA|nr:hypothetical protein [Stylosanthes scabra]
MAKGGKLTKLRSVLKKWNSFGSKQSRHNSSAVADDEDDNNRTRELHPVYVGKSRRLYRVSSEVVEHPVFRELVERSREEQEAEAEDDVGRIVACEVVLFEHLLWMLENGDPQPHELVDFYAC